MYWPPNIDGVLWFIREVFPRIRARRPDVVFDVIGARPPRALVELSGDGTGINVTGYVRDPTSYFEQAGVMVVPVRAGGGIRVKILEALALQLPVVTTRLGCEGIAVESGRHLIIADEPGEFAEAVLHLLDNRRLADALGQNGRRLIEAQYDYRMACRPLDRVYQTLR
jgi:glycosyltransferase involved in cell wall biosynthesis